jgi:hypothetical protein
MWTGGTHRVRLEPESPARLFRVRAWTRSEHDFDYFMEPTLVPGAPFGGS